MCVRGDSGEAILERISDTVQLKAIRCVCMYVCVCVCVRSCVTLGF